MLPTKQTSTEQFFLFAVSKKKRRDPPSQNFWPAQVLPRKTPFGRIANTHSLQLRPKGLPAIVLPAFIPPAGTGKKLNPRVPEKLLLRGNTRISHSHSEYYMNKNVRCSLSFFHNLLKRSYVRNWGFQNTPSQTTHARHWSAVMLPW